MQWPPAPLHLAPSGAGQLPCLLAHRPHPQLEEVEAALREKEEAGQQEASALGSMYRLYKAEQRLAKRLGEALRREKAAAKQAAQAAARQQAELQARGRALGWAPAAPLPAAPLHPAAPRFLPPPCTLPPPRALSNTHRWPCLCSACQPRPKPCTSLTLFPTGRPRVQARLEEKEREVERLQRRNKDLLEGRYSRVHGPTEREKAAAAKATAKEARAAAKRKAQAAADSGAEQREAAAKAARLANSLKENAGL